MTDDRSPGAEKLIFLAALEIETPADRAAYLDQACAGDERLQAGVEALLAAHERLGSIHLDAGESMPDAGPPAERPGTAVGPYRLVEQIGEGGMGLVFVAEQERPVRRRVALKVIKPGLDTRQVIARFEAERQALAVMDHPNVARVLDAGATASGRPFFVMELIQGIPITEYSDQCELSTRQRLELFVQVCRGIQHAHQKGIIHRDVKPSNVLVAMQDRRPVAKVIDFGVAKAINQKLSERTLETGFAQMLGTPLYMSPEQAEMSPLELDTRSDIYSLGVLLYELLTGTTPFDRRQIHEASFEGIRRLIREVEPPTPSARISTLGETALAVAQRRRTDPRQLAHEVGGDLDWIAMRCLEKDRARRYETASALAADVERHLQDQPVEAGSPSRIYRLRKFARRHRSSLAMAGSLLLALAVLTGSLGWMARDRAGRRAALEREVASALEEVETRFRMDDGQEAISALRRAEGLLASGGAGGALAEHARRWRGNLEMATALEEVRMEQVIEKEGGFDWSHTDQAYAQAFRRHGLDLDTIEAGAAARRIEASAIRADLLAALDNWVLAKHMAGLPGRERLLDVARRADVDPWRNRLREAISQRDRKVLVELAREEGVMAQPPADIMLLGRILRELEEGPAAVEVLRRAQGEHPADYWINIGLGFSLEDAAPAQAAGFYRAALAVRPESFAAHLCLGNALANQGQLDGALEIYGKGLALHPGEAKLHLNQGTALARKGLFAEAETATRRAIELQPREAVGHFNLGRILGQQGRVDEALAAYRQAIAVDPKLYQAHHNLGEGLAKQGKLDEAIAAFRQALALKPLARTHRAIAQQLDTKGDPAGSIAELEKAMALEPGNAEDHYNLGVSLYSAGRREEAVAAYGKAIELDPARAKAHLNLGVALNGLGRMDEAIAALRRAVAADPRLLQGHINLGLILSHRGQLDEAAAAYRKALEVDPTSLEVRLKLGVVLGQQGKLDEAVAELRQAIALKPDEASAHGDLGTALQMQGKLAEAIAAYRESLALDPDSPMTHLNLGLALRDQGEFAAALAELQRGHQLGSRDPRWPHPSAEWVEYCERLADLDRRLPHVLAGEETVSGAERLAFADLCYRKRRFEQAASFYAEAFAEEPTLAEDLAHGHRYNAACVAALAGAGEGQDAGSLAGDARAVRRDEARAWLRADLTLHASRLDGARARASTVMMLKHWLRDPDLKGLRDEDLLAALPPAERPVCADLWRDVRKLLESAEGKEP